MQSAVCNSQGLQKAFFKLLRKQIDDNALFKRNACLNRNRSPGLENQPGENPPLIGTRDTTLQFALSIVHFEVSLHYRHCANHIVHWARFQSKTTHNALNCGWQLQIMQQSLYILSPNTLQCSVGDRAKRVAHRWILMWVGRAQAFRTPLAFRSSSWSPVSSWLSGYHDRNGHRGRHCCHCHDFHCSPGRHGHYGHHGHNGHNGHQDRQENQDNQDKRDGQDRQIWHLNSNISR